MKKLIILYFFLGILLIAIGCSNYYENNKTVQPKSINNAKEENINNLIKNGLEIIKENNIQVELDNWGKIRFVPGQKLENGNYKVYFYLLNEKGNVIFKLPNFSGNKFWTFYEIRDISFIDLNSDGLKDIIIIADFMTGVGNEGAVSFPVSNIYFQNQNGFYNIPKLDDSINDSNNNESIEKVIKFIKNNNELLK